MINVLQNGILVFLNISSYHEIYVHSHNHSRNHNRSHNRNHNHNPYAHKKPHSILQTYSEAVPHDTSFQVPVTDGDPLFPNEPRR